MSSHIVIGHVKTRTALLNSSIEIMNYDDTQRSHSLLRKSRHFPMNSDRGNVLRVFVFCVKYICMVCVARATV